MAETYIEPRLARSAAVTAVGTVASRVTGLFRVLALTFALGIAETRLADSFNVANSLPNILYDLALGGVLSSVFVPLVVDALRDPQGRRDVGTLVGTALVLLLAVSVLASLFAPFLVRLFTFRGGATEAAQTALAGFLFRFFAFQILFYGIAAMAGGLLNARNHFAVPAFAPAANNVVAIVVFLMFAAVVGRADVDELSGGAKLLLGLGSTAAVAAMAVISWVPVRRVVGPMRLKVSFSNPLVRRFARLSMWTAVYVGTTQVEGIVTYVLAYGVQGGATAYITALSFFQLPYAVLAASVMTVLIPRLAERAADGDLDGFRDRLEDGIVLTITMILPAGVAYAVVAGPAMDVLLVRGQVTAESAAFVARLVQIFTVGLLGYSLWLLFLRAFYSLQDARTPALVNFAAAAGFVVLDLLLYPFFKVEGLGWVHAIGYSFAAYYAGRALDRRVGGLDWPFIAGVGLRVAAASAVTGVAMTAVVLALRDEIAGVFGDLVVIATALAAGAAAFLAAATLLDIEQVREVRRLNPLRRGGAGPAR